MRSRWLQYRAVFLVLSVAGGCAHGSRRSHEDTCKLFPTTAAQASGAVTPPATDLWTLKPHWIYQVVTSVEPVGDHFTIWYQDDEPTMVRVRVQRDPHGHLAITSEGETWGGVGSGPAYDESLSSDVAALEKELEAEFRRRCPGYGFRTQYLGRNRTVNVQRFVALDVRRLNPSRFGWIAHSTFSMDEGLTRVLGTKESWTGLGLINVLAGSAWVAAAEPDAGLHRPFIDPADAGLFEAARRYGKGAPPIDPATLVPADAPLFPPGYVSRVVLKVTVGGAGRSHGGIPMTEMRLPLSVHDAVFGPGATAEALVDVGLETARLHLSASLTPNSPRAPTPGLAIIPYEGTLTVHAADERGHSWQRAYVARGEIAADGELVVAPAGFVVPGSSCPSPECDARSGVVPGDRPGDGTSVRVEPGVSDDRR